MRTRWWKRGVAAVLCVVACGQAPRAATGKAGPSREGAVAVTRAFLAGVDRGEVEGALKWWDKNAVKEGLVGRVGKMSAKVKGLGGIKRVDAGACEPRRIENYEREKGERIEVVPVEIICGGGDLLLAVFSARQVEGKPKIFQLESLKEWGGTASLDEEIGYQH